MKLTELKDYSGKLKDMVIDYSAQSISISADIYGDAYNTGRTPEKKVISLSFKGVKLISESSYVAGLEKYMELWGDHSIWWDQCRKRGISQIAIQGGSGITINASNCTINRKVPPVIQKLPKNLMATKDLGKIELHDANLNHMAIDYRAKSVSISVDYYEDMETSRYRTPALIIFEEVNIISQVTNLVTLDDHASAGNIVGWETDNNGITGISLCGGFICIQAKKLQFKKVK